MQKILVTGAAGFLGGWVVESFQAAGIPVRAGLRRWNSAVRLARSSSEIVLCDVLSREQVNAALDGCDAVVHCAVGDEHVTVQGTRNVLAAAEQRNVKRIVHVSSVAVYGKADGVIDEQHPRRSRGNRYAHYKIEAERVCEEFVARGMPVVVLRPSIIYGPFSAAWTVSFAMRILSGKWGTFGKRAEGTCNLVYVTDVVQAIHRALESPQADGQFFNVNGDELMTWNEFFQRFNDALQQPALRPIPTWPIAMKARLFTPVRSVAKFALSRFGKSILALHARSSLAAKYMGATESGLKLTPTSEQLKLYGVKAVYEISQARSVLGYAPRVPAEQGLAFSVAWLRQQGLAP